MIYIFLRLTHLFMYWFCFQIVYAVLLVKLSSGIGDPLLFPARPRNCPSDSAILDFVSCYFPTDERSLCTVRGIYGLREMKRAGGNTLPGNHDPRAGVNWKGGTLAAGLRRRVGCFRKPGRR